MDRIYRQHGPLDRRLRVPRRWAGVQRLLSAADPGLRLRRSVERPDLWVLERKVRRAPAINTAMTIRSDMHLQARDGYLHVSTVHPNWFIRPGNIIRALKEEGVDLWEQGGARRVVDEIEYEERWAKETRRRRRRQRFAEIARDHFDLLNRLGNKDGTERTRISVPG